MPRVVCVGANIESETVLSRFLDSKAEIAGLVTLPPRSAHGVSDYRDLHPLCREFKVPVVDTEDINNEATLDAIAGLDPEYIFVLGWSQIFKEDLLSLPSGFVVGSHPTGLPERRGRAPIPWTILEGHRKSAVSLFRMASGADNGPLLLQRWFDIPERAYAMEVYQQVSEKLAQAFIALYQGIQEGTLTEREQDESAASYRAKRVPADGFIDFLQPAEYVDRLIRAVSEPFPGAYTYYIDRMVKIWRADPYKGPEYRGVPGQILKRQHEGIVVQAGDLPVVLRELTVEGKPAGAGDFSVGEVFGYRTADMISDIRRRISVLEEKSGGGNS